MLSDDERKMLLRMLRTEVLLQVSLCSTQRIDSIVETDVGVTTFSQEIWDNVMRSLRKEHPELMGTTKLAEFDYLHRLRSVLGSLKTAHADLKDKVPPGIDMKMLAYWDSSWEEQRSRNKRMKLMQAETFPKHVLRAQDLGAGSSSRPDASGTDTIVRTRNNSKCGLTVSVPHECLRQGMRIGAGSFGTVYRYTVEGVSFFPEHITYCGKNYKGQGSSKFANFEKEQGMQVVHPSLVRCIGYTQCAPWITIFPFFNGGSLGETLLLIPRRRSSLWRVAWRLKSTIGQAPPPERNLTSIEMGRVRAVFANMPHIMHAIVDGLAAAHNAGILHTDLHVFNVVMDYTLDNRARVGIIDWGLLLRTPSTRPAYNYVADPDHNKERYAAAKAEMEMKKSQRPWIAPELLDPCNADAFTESSDVYALGYILDKLHEFWRAAQDVYNLDSIDRDIMEKIRMRIHSQMLVLNPLERKSVLTILEFFRSLNTEPARAQRPLVETNVQFM